VLREPAATSPPPREATAHAGRPNPHIQPVPGRRLDPDGLASTMESAVRAGHLATNAILGSDGRQGDFLSRIFLPRASCAWFGGCARDPARKDTAHRAALEEELRPAIESSGCTRRKPDVLPERGGTPWKAGPLPENRSGPRTRQRSLRRALEKGRTNGVLITGTRARWIRGCGSAIWSRHSARPCCPGRRVRETWRCGRPISCWKREGGRAERVPGRHCHLARPRRGPGTEIAFPRPFGAAAVDMETARWRGSPPVWHVPVACVRVVTDEATDIFEPGSPESHRPSWWEQKTVVARQSLSAFSPHFSRRRPFASALRCRGKSAGHGCPENKSDHEISQISLMDDLNL